MSKDSYAAAGVDIAAADRTLELIKPAVRATYTPHVVTDVGSYGGMFALDLSRWREPVLVGSVDSVGTKVMVAAAAGQHGGVGYDMVHHSVNDIAVMGAEPLFFLDYYATAKLEPEIAAEVIGGLAAACREVGCALVGGELAELPGMYTEGHYDLVGTIVGAVDRSNAIDGSRVGDGDALLALPSVGLHTNGYSLARKVLLADAGLDLHAVPAGLEVTLAEALLAPHRCYLAPLRALWSAGLLRAAAHITGGGVYDNLPRVLPKGWGAQVRRGTWPEPPIFGLIARLGQVPAADLFRTFNMGLGMLVVVAQADVEAAHAALTAVGSEAYLVGEVTAAHAGVVVAEA
ncbi:MAG TPA: phosphoribosylformylglycinamidine cyclo-ligase [Armatimonadetes bacterium]|nr:phosphoribosylformylglycinamidine cyclo-ligase [Armatimonadota bacterium]